jgi:hypothetical protein
VKLERRETRLSCGARLLRIVEAKKEATSAGTSFRHAFDAFCAKPGRSRDYMDSLRHTRAKVKHLLDRPVIINWIVQGQMEILKKSRQERGNSRFDKLVALIKTRNGISLRDLKKNHGFEEQETRQIIDENPRLLWIEEPKNDGKRGRKPSPMVWLVGWKQAVRQAVGS